MIKVQIYYLFIIISHLITGAKVLLFFAKHQKWACTYLQKSVNKTKLLC